MRRLASLLESSSMIPEITPLEAKQKLESGETALLDVREDWEVAHCKIEGCVHIPLGKVRQAAPEALDRNSDIIVYCHHGTRSLMAANVLRRLGFERVSNLTGGIDAWSLQVDDAVPRY